MGSQTEGEVPRKRMRTGEGGCLEEGGRHNGKVRWEMEGVLPRCMEAAS